MILQLIVAVLLAAVPSKKAVQPIETDYRRTPYVGAMAVEFANPSNVLFESSADRLAYPASVTKLMTAFLVLDDVKSGKLSMNDMVVASPTQSAADVWARQASHIGLVAGESLSVNEMLIWLMVRSANDAAVFLAEKCAGSVDAFVDRMNQKARSLGMKSTKYYNPNGLPPPRSDKVREFNVSTCRDQACLAEALLREHPEILKFTSIKNRIMRVPVTNRKKQRIIEDMNIVNHNNVMVKDKLKIINPDGTEAVDGLKTGYIDAGGSSVLLTARRGGKRVIVVVLGSSSAKVRDENAVRIVTDALGAISW